VYTESITNTLNSWVHVGSNTVFLTPGIDFDFMSLRYTLHRADEVTFDMNHQPVVTGNPSSTTLQGPLPIFGAPDQKPFHPGITYVAATTTTPEPRRLRSSSPDSRRPASWRGGACAADAARARQQAGRRIE
jgi:hypothetical protein